jgi:hypothetical protein
LTMTFIPFRFVGMIFSTPRSQHATRRRWIGCVGCWGYSEAPPVRAGQGEREGGG